MDMSVYYEIEVPIDEVWDYYLDNEEEILEEQQMHRLAYSYEFEIYLNSTGHRPEIQVFDWDGDLVYQAEYAGEHDLKQAYSEIVSDYFNVDVKVNSSEIGVSDAKEGFTTPKTSDVITSEMIRSIQDSECDLSIYTEEFIENVMGLKTSKLGITDKQIEDAKNAFLLYIYKEMGLDIERPMVLTFEDGSKRFYLNPYPYMEI